MMEHLILAAFELGLVTCWVGAFNPDTAKGVLNLNEGWEPLIFTPIGYLAEYNTRKTRKDLKNLLFINKN